MKKLHIFFTALFLMLFFATNVSAQEKKFFTGNWNITVEGTPGGDSKMIVQIIEKDGVLTGAILDPTTSKEVTKFNKVEAKNDTITVYFTSQGFDVYLFLEKKDQDNITGTMMDMFDATGKRVK